ncbi:MAG: branched-chain amino acid transport system ATP-binding protein [Pseudonocardiales bacterium]|jgi:branched-chain amino acid transport system ATP-binding protein|nr:branched-chain amino acid transport system ATP-binding protein [Pseudonocardiales bacterium]MDT5218350.1 branched-chain amino acid transport system ATP-binding protein [Mycobacterium sp.]
MSDLELAVEQLSVGYGRSLIVKSVSLRVGAGELVVIVGPNGSGKSTLMKGISGVLPATSGRIVIRGAGPDVEVTSLPPEQAIRAGVGYVPQHSNVFPSLSIEENLQLGCYIAPKRAKARIIEIYQLFPDLADARRRAARTLSGGQRGMLALGRALMASPAVVLVDEPTAGLSPRYRDVVWQQLIHLRDAGVALLVVEQNTRAALEIGDRGYVLVNGEVSRDADCADLLADDELIKLYIGA